MRLQRLEIKGFKSFANETVINFNEDVIGVVGPNGAGKSNLVDAVRWVLGEQKGKELRLDKMSDVIFNGTKKRKAGGVAYVALTFENTKNLLPTEYQTVTIGRYLYRSGESEYRLNNVACRLKDIRSLFLDTGIGSNSYAIIALGMVEDILTDKENARRRMFEQAAGISKYKTRKKETLNKLKSTQSDLDRIEDLLFEIEGNLKVLEKQSRRTQRYFDLKEKYKAHSIELAIIKIKDLKENYQGLTTRIQTEQDVYRAYDVKIHELEAALEQLKQKHLDKEKSLSEFQRSMNELISNIRTAENDRKILEQKQSFVQQTQNTLTKRIEINRQRIGELNQGTDEHSASLSEITGMEEKLRIELEQAKDELSKIQSGHGSTRTALDNVIKVHQSKQNELVGLEKELVVRDTNTSAAHHEIKKIEDQIKSQNEGYALAEKSLNVLLSQIEEQLNAVQVLEKQEFERQSKRAELETKEDQLDAALNHLNRQRDAKRHEFELIKSLVDKLEGFPDSIKYLNKSDKWNREAPLLSDLIYCAESHRIVIENYLEPYLNHYVVDTVADAADAIRLLSDAQKGRANFFVLEAFYASIEDHKVLEGAQAAIDVVEVESKYDPVVRHLLHNVFISDQIDLSDIQLAEDSGIVILSADGQFIRKKLSLCGGSVGLFEGKKLGRKKYLKKLEEKLKDLDEKYTKKEEKLDAINDALAALDEADSSEQLDGERKQLEELKRKEVYVKSRLEHFGDLGSGLNKNIEGLRLRLTELDGESRQIKAQMAKVVAELEAERAQMENVDDSFNEIARKLADQSALVNQKNIELIRHQSRKQQIEREQSFNVHQLKELTHQVDTDALELTKAEGEEKGLEDQIGLLKEDLKSHYDVRKSQEGDLSGLEQSYYAARGEITQIEDQVRTTHKKQTDQQQMINDLKDTFTEVKFKMGNVGERLKIEFDISLEEVLQQEHPEGVDLEELDLKVEKMRNRINNYGEINPMAVDAYSEMNERYETITTQRDDILEARDSLLETIKEIEETATERFMEAFTQVRTNFIEVFRSLFTEDDNCDLVLLNPETPLTSAIEIIAKPKGKRPKTLSQLSGGEKTLTAIALLFGLYLLKPAPFCIFDEVDAPLDDTNIEKFNRIIKQFSNKSQFIIVTHNKLTMAAVDVIYGVYMEEQGVSNVSPVDFRSFSHTSTLEVVQ